MNTTIITPTVGTPHIARAVQSVLDQTRPARHLIVVDGAEHYARVWHFIRELWNPATMSIIVLPENTGLAKFYGHRIYAAVPLLVNTPFFAYLDEDNEYTANFVERMEREIITTESVVVTCRRYVLTKDGETIGLDDFESIGVSPLGYSLHDTNTYLFRQAEAPRICRHIYGKWGADRKLTNAVLTMAKQGVLSHKHIQFYGVKYYAPDNLIELFTKHCTKI